MNDWIDIPNLQTVDLPHSFKIVYSKSITSIIWNSNEWIDVSPILADLVHIRESDSDISSDSMSDEEKEEEKDESEELTNSDSLSDVDVDADLDADLDANVDALLAELEELTNSLEIDPSSKLANPIVPNEGDSETNSGGVSNDNVNEES